MSSDENHASGSTPTSADDNEAVIASGDFRRILGAHPDGIIVLDADGVVRFANDAAEQHFHAIDGLVGTPLGLPVSDHDRPIELEVPSSDGSYRVLETVATPTWWQSQPATLLTSRDVTTPTVRIRDLQRSNERFALAMDGSNDGLWDWDLAEGTLHVNHRWRQLLGLDHLPEDDNDASLWLDRVHPVDRHSVEEAIDEHLHGRSDHLTVQHRLRHHDGEYVWMLSRGRAVFALDGRATRFAGSLTDVTHRVRLEERLRHEAHHDALTGLANRRLLLDRLAAAVARHDRSAAGFAVIMLDLDGFKQINDHRGHDVGDAVLIEVARRLEEHIRPHDLAARLGGDEFAVLLEDLGPEQLGAVASRLHEHLAAPHFVDGVELVAPGSIGVALPRHATTVSGLLRVADEAMYQAKTTGKPVISRS